MKISIIIIASNNEDTIYECLNSVQQFDEVIVYLNNSQDNTKNIAQKFSNVKIIDGYFDGFGSTKNRAISYTNNDWIFVLDSDEIISEELKQEILKLDFKFDAYLVPRLNNFFGKWIKYGGLYPDYTIRLFHKNKAQFNNRKVHESIYCNCKKDYLKNNILHYAYDNINQFIDKQNKYSSMNAKSNKFKAIFAPYWTFIKMFIIKKGFLDGWYGYIIAKLYSQYTFWKYIKEKNES